MIGRTWRQLDALTGGLSDPSKMPGRSYGIPAAECHRGSVLRSVAGSTCEGCYALKGRYAFDSVQAAQYRRFGQLTRRGWVGAMAESIEKARPAAGDYFRWHDSGDVQSEAHLLRIFAVCRATPDVQHWLPTREYAIVKRVLKSHTCPPNLTIRVSAALVNGTPPALGLATSTVTTEPGRDACPARLTAKDGRPGPWRDNGYCGDCRRCWDGEVANVPYPKH